MFCRLCLIESPSECFQIFDAEGSRMRIAEIISQHFWFTPLQDDCVSEIVCSKCWVKISNFHQYYLSVVIAQKQLSRLSLKKYENDTKGANEEWILEITPNLVTTNVEENSQIESDSEFDQDFGHGESDGIGSSDDDNDDDYFTPKVNIKKEKQIKLENSGDELHEENSDEPKVARPKKTAHQIKMEKEDEEIRKYIKFDCDVCRKEYTTYSMLKWHIKHEHRRPGYAVCCNKKIHKRVLLLDHYKLHLNPEAFKCVHCEKTFVNSISLMNHLHMKHRDLDNSNMITCDYCPRKFSTQELYEEHKKTRHKELPCKHCKKIFYSQAYLKYHERRVHEKAYVKVCDICAKVVPSESLLRIHMLEHSGQTLPRYQCKECGKLSKTQRCLTLHMNKHKEALMNLKCNVCGKSAPSIHALRCHIKYVHERVNNFKCNLCPKAFNKALTLKEHMTTHTGGALYSCAFCSKTFNSNANMYSHRKKAHPKEWLESKHNTSVNAIVET